MTIAQVRNNIYATSSQQTVTNILPKPGTTTPDYWYPSANDKTPSLRINMPDVDELMPDDYDIMSVEIKAVNFESVTVKVTDAANRVIVDVSYFASFAVNCNHHWQRGDYCRGLPLASATVELDKIDSSQPTASTCDSWLCPQDEPIQQISSEIFSGLTRKICCVLYLIYTNFWNGLSSKPPTDRRFDV